MSNFGTLSQEKNRKYETKITRLCIGHTRLTNGYHMFRGRPHGCIHLGKSWPTNRLLIVCQTTKNIREQLELPSYLQRLLGEECLITSLIRYLILLNILHAIWKSKFELFTWNSNHVVLISWKRASCTYIGSL